MMQAPSEWSLHELEETDSTNARLLEAAGGGGPLDRPWTVLRAGHQSAGRGRAGRGWDCPPDEGLLFSFRLDLDLERHALPLVGHWAALALARTLERALAEADSPTRVWWKWPNDILLEDRAGAGKLAGILVQTKVQGREAVVVIGVGLNLRQRAFPAGLRLPARSLAQAGLELAPRDLLEDLLPELATPPRAAGPLLAALAPRDLLASRPVWVDGGLLGGHEHLADGRLRLELAGERVTLAAGGLRVTAIEKEALRCQREN
jgi:BirA family biotin operon repressor/biotin-[acetyl-CoA-carboxylase] ligase